MSTMQNKRQPRMNNISIENAQIGFRNFEGKPGKYNAEGNRNFAVFLENETALTLQEEGWNVRWLNPRSEDDEPQAMISVKVAFGNYPPKVVLIKEGKRSELSETTISLLDWAEIDTVDLILRPYQYNVNGKEGVKAYLKTMYCVLVTDKFADKYESTPDSAQDAVGGCGNCGVCNGECSKHEHL